MLTRSLQRATWSPTLRVCMCPRDTGLVPFCCSRVQQVGLPEDRRRFGSPDTRQRVGSLGNVQDEAASLIEPSAHPSRIQSLSILLSICNLLPPWDDAEKEGRGVLTLVRHHVSPNDLATIHDYGLGSAVKRVAQLQTSQTRLARSCQPALKHNPSLRPHLQFRLVTDIVPRPTARTEDGRSA